MMPPGIEPVWDDNSELVQSFLLAYDQVRQIEDIELAVAVQGPRIQL